MRKGTIRDFLSIQRFWSNGASLKEKFYLEAKFFFVPGSPVVMKQILEKQAFLFTSRFISIRPYYGTTSRHNN